MTRILLLILFCFHCFLFAKDNNLRIVSLAPNLTEIVYALGLGEHLVGDTLQCDYPQNAKIIYKVGDYINPNIERILSVKPNYVLATIGNPRAILNKLEMQGVHVVVVEDPKNARELTSSIEKIANELHVQNQGTLISKKIKDAIINLQNHKVKNRKFLFLIQFDPIYSVSNKTWIGNIFTLGGYENIVGDSKISYPVVTHEYLIKNPPDIVFSGSDIKLTLEQNKKIQMDKLKKIFGDKVAQKIQLVFLPKDLLVRPGPRIVDGIHFLESLSF